VSNCQRLDTLIDRLVETLPETEYGQMWATTGGDPRGCVVSLEVPLWQGTRTIGVW